MDGWTQALERRDSRWNEALHQKSRCSDRDSGSLLTCVERQILRMAQGGGEKK